MNAPPVKRSVAVCRGKRRHPDECTARAAAMNTIERHGNVAVLYVYRCPQCRGWHLTRFNNGIGAKVTVDNPVHVAAGRMDGAAV